MAREMILCGSPRLPTAAAAAGQPANQPIQGLVWLIALKMAAIVMQAWRALPDAGCFCPGCFNSQYFKRLLAISEVCRLLVFRKTEYPVG